jgi:hypothetical protein
VTAEQQVDRAVVNAVDAWLRWVATWKPGTQRTRGRLCRKCTGSPFVQASGLATYPDVPHQVTHALVSRMHRIIDRTVDEYTEHELPALHAELEGSNMWQKKGFDPTADLAPEYEGLDVDPEPESHEQPFLFTLGELAEKDSPEPPLPRPPLSAGEKAQIKQDIDRADNVASDTGRLICFALAHHKGRITRAIDRFVEPQIQSLLDELSKHLEPPQ